MNYCNISLKNTYYFIQDLCVEIYSKTEDGQSDLFCKEIEDTGEY